jgi:hypothetical protein
MADLAKVMADLYAQEINCGIESFWDAGFTVWIGDDLNERKAEATFKADELDQATEWLAANAETAITD